MTTTRSNRPRRGEQFHVFFAIAVERGVGQFFQQDVRFAIERAVAQLDDSVPDGLSKMTFPCARTSFKAAVLAPFHPTGSSHGAYAMDEHCESGSGILLATMLHEI